jgi:hypothetical protein
MIRQGRAREAREGTARVRLVRGNESKSKSEREVRGGDKNGVECCERGDKKETRACTCARPDILRG